MKLIILALAVVAVVVAAPPPSYESKPPVEIVSQEYEQNPDGSYHASYKSADGTVREEYGEIKQVTGEDNKPATILAVHGLFSYVNPEGKTTNTEYRADENGFVATGDAIQKS